VAKRKKKKKFYKIHQRVFDGKGYYIDSVVQRSSLKAAVHYANQESYTFYDDFVVKEYPGGKELGLSRDGRMMYF